MSRQCDSSMNVNAENDEISSEVSYLRIELEKQTKENENYQQELYETRRKLEGCLAMQQELTEANEALEETVAREAAAAAKKLQDFEEKRAANKEEYEERIAEMENELACQAKENEELREIITAKGRSATTVPEDSLLLKEEISNLKEKVCDLTHTLKEREEITETLLKRQQRFEETIKALREQLEEVNSILKAKKEELVSNKGVLETTRDELTLCRAELDSLKATPASDSIKGNSLFAEVEDRRQMMLHNMTALRTNYLNMKRTYGSKEAEIRALKAERAALLRKWEDDTIEKVDQDAKLIEIYKARISELERKFKDEQKKAKLTQGEAQHTSGNTFSYLQSLLNTKKKEVEELQIQLEDNSIQRVLQEEIKHEIVKQLRHWRYKAMSAQAQLIALRSHLECDSAEPKPDSQKPIEIITDMDEQLDQFLTDNPTSSAPLIVDESQITLEKLIEVPKPQIKQYKNTADIDVVKKYYDPLTEVTDLKKAEKYIAMCENYSPSSGTEAMFSFKSKDSESLSKKDEASVEVIQLSTSSVSAENTIIMNGSDNNMSLTGVYETVSSDEKTSVSAAYTKTLDSSNDMNLTCMSDTVMLGENTGNISTIHKDMKAETLISVASTISVSESNNENSASVSNLTDPTLKSALVKPERKLSYRDEKENEKKSLRFTADTVDPKGTTLTRQKESKKKYPIVFISSKTSK